MRIAIISDIHANQFALKRVLVDLENQNIDQIICLGDVASSGPMPHETVQLLSRLDCLPVMGNTDAELLHPTPYEGDDEFYKIISAIHAWCAAQLSPDDLSFMRTFQPTIKIQFDQIKSLLCFHGSPKSNTDLINSNTPQLDLERLLSEKDVSIFAGGHSHQQMMRSVNQSTYVNPGSVGLAFESSKLNKNNVPWAEYIILDIAASSHIVEFKRVKYDFSALKETVLEKNMPFGEWWIHQWNWEYNN